MPNLVTLDATAARFFESKRGTSAAVTEYEKELRDLQPGDIVEAIPEGKETARAVKRNLTMAAKQMGFLIRYSRHAPKSSVVFRFEGPKEKAVTT